MVVRIGLLMDSLVFVGSSIFALDCFTCMNYIVIPGYEPPSLIHSSITV